MLRRMFINFKCFIMNLKHLAILLCLIFSISVTTAQKPRKIKNVTKFFGYYTAKYSVLKSNKKVKHGSYETFDYHTNKIIVSGNYYLGKKNDLWTEWYQTTDVLKSEGNYKENQKVGVWKYNDYKGEMLHSYNYDTKTLLYSRECGNDKEYEVILDGESVWIKLDCPPEMIGGITNLSIDIANTYFMSKKDNKNSVGGIHANISILIKKDGTVGDMKSNDSFLNSEYISILEEKINNTKGEWLPAELNGEKVDAYVNFKSWITSTRRKE